MPGPAALAGWMGARGERGGLAPPALRLNNPLVPEAGYHLCRRREGSGAPNLKAHFEPYGSN